MPFFKSLMLLETTVAASSWNPSDWVVVKGSKTGFPLSGNFGGVGGHLFCTKSYNN